MSIIDINNICKKLDRFSGKHRSNLIVRHLSLPKVTFLEPQQVIQLICDDMVVQIFSWKLVVLDHSLSCLNICYRILLTVIKVDLLGLLEDVRILFDLIFQANNLYAWTCFFQELTFTIIQIFCSVLAHFFSWATLLLRPSRLIGVVLLIAVEGSWIGVGWTSRIVTTIVIIDLFAPHTIQQGFFNATHAYFDYK